MRWRRVPQSTASSTGGPSGGEGSGRAAGSESPDGAGRHPAEEATTPRKPLDRGEQEKLLDRLILRAALIAQDIETERILIGDQHYFSLGPGGPRGLSRAIRTLEEEIDRTRRERSLSIAELRVRFEEEVMGKLAEACRERAR